MAFTSNPHTTTATVAATTMVATVAAILSIAPTEAMACGGFFCSQNAPVNQAAERIIFSDNGDGTVTSIVQIQYNGPSEQFAWVLPVPGIPEIGVSSDTVFTRLQGATNPQYNLTVDIEGECGLSNNDGGFAAAGDSTSANNGTLEGDPGGVNVLASGVVGPYDFVVIMIDPSLDDLADVATTWLDDNGYDVAGIAPDLIRPYLEDGMNLVAFRLTKGNSDGDIRPVVLTFDSEAPMIPIKLTAVAAEEDMGVLVWVLSNSRAVPINYRSLEINEAIINWFNAGPSYNNVINVAADEAGGQGFVTEFAGPSEPLANLFTTSNNDPCIPSFPTSDNLDAQTIASVVRSTLSICRDTTGIGQSLRQALPPEDMQDISGFTTCIRTWGISTTEGSTLVCEDFQDNVRWTLDIAELNTELFATAMYDNIVAPIEEVQQLFRARSYVTRLYTTMSAAEMTVDPIFQFNPELSDLSNIHQATQVIECSPFVDISNAPWRIELPQGDVVRGRGGSWPIDSASMPANRQVLQDNTSGQPEVVEDNTALIRQAIEDNNAQFQSEEGCACTTLSARTTAPTGPLTLSVLALMGMVAIGRQRR